MKDINAIVAYELVGLAKDILNRPESGLNPAPTAINLQKSQFAADAVLLQWLENNLDRFGIECNLAAITPFWLTKWDKELKKMVTFAEGKDLRTAIKNAIETELHVFKG